MMKFSSFRLPILISIFFILAILTGTFLLSTRMSPEDQASYNQMAQDQIEKHELRKKGEVKKETKHVRWNVLKRLWLSDKVPRLGVEMQGARSEVTVGMKKSEARLVETFHDVQGVIQQELFYKTQNGEEIVFTENGGLKKRGQSAESPEEIFDVTVLQPMQRFRYFEADRAIYDFRTHTLIAYNVNFWTYCVQGHDLTKERSNLWPETSGSATSMTVCHAGSVGTLQFAAENLNMQITPEW